MERGETAMSTVNEPRPFDSIESSREYVGLLLQTIEEAATDVGEGLALTPGDGTERRHEAFQLVAYKLERLRVHVATTRRLLNHLRNLRLMLDGERLLIPIAAAGQPNGSSSGGPRSRGADGRRAPRHTWRAAAA
jgi:hypothetical protein